MSRVGPIVAVYPGSFDPITNGHLDLVSRGTKIADKLVVAILNNDQKKHLFSLEERLEIARKVLKPLHPDVEVDSFDGLLADYAAAREAKLILRGIRAVSDYEFELQMALMNRRLRPQVETVFLLPREDYSFLSSRMIKEVMRLGGNVQGLVPPLVEEKLREKFERNLT
jgi:pantetheine-phosphate adenylyltransferase